MKEFIFSLEYDGRNTIKKSANRSNISIKAASIREAVRALCNQEKVKATGVTMLMNSNNYRAYFMKKSNILGGSKELIYLVKEIKHEEEDLYLQYPTN